ncbi:MAG: AsmA family protein [Betaproteobacteria bacterium]
MAIPFPSGRLARGIAIAVAALVVLVIVLALVPFLIPVNSLKPTLVRTIQENTGYRAEIGSLRLALLPTVHLKVDDLKLSTPPGLPGGELLSVGETDLDVAIAPLFRKHIRVTGLTLKDVRANAVPAVPVRRPAEAAAAARRKTSPAEPSPAGEGGEPAFAFAPGTPVVARPVAIVVNSFGPGLKITPVATISGLSARIENLSAVGQPDWLKQLRVTVGLSDASVKAAALTSPLEFSSGDIVVDSGAAKGTFKSRLADMSIGGRLAVPDISNPRVSLDLDIPTVDATALGALMAGGGGATSTGPKEGGQPMLTGTLKIGTVKASGLEARQFAGHLAVGGRTRLDPFSFTLYGGSVRGSASFDSSPQGLRLTVQASGVNVGQALAATGGRGRTSLTGTLELTGDLSASPSNLEESLAGSGRFDIRNGTFPGLNMQAALAEMNKLLQLNVPEGDTHFTSLNGDYRVAAGRINSRQVALVGQGLDVTLHGSAGFDGTLDYTGTAVYKPGEEAPAAAAPQSSSPFSLLKRAAKGAVSGALRRNVGTIQVPFHVGGTSSKPLITPAGVPAVK